MIDFSKFVSLPWLEERTIYTTRHGSRCYGTNTPTSDEDFKGFCVPPKEYFLGFHKKFEQAESHDPDLVIYDIRKFMNLAADCNPSIIEVLWTADEDRIILKDAALPIFENRDLFLSRKAKYTFCGYAVSQLKRIRTHRRWLINPPAAPPTREEFGLPERTVIPKDQLMAAEAEIKKVIESWDVDWEPLDKATRIQTQGKLTEFMEALTMPEDALMRRAGRVIGYDENFIELLDKERGYRARMHEWQQYQTWKATRNPARAELEAKHGFDCYSDDTEFLTRSGWKTFDAIGSKDELATVFARRGCEDESMAHRKFLGVEYQRAVDRFEGQYTGSMYHITGQHTDSLVTPNHRMLFRRIERNTGRKHNWELEEAAFLPDTFDVLIAPTPRAKCYSNGNVFDGLPIPDRSYLTLMGWYLSDGCVMFNGKKAKAINISQAKNGKLYWKMGRWNSDHGNVANSSVYNYLREPNEYNPRPHVERILSVRNKAIVSRLANECGSRDMKRIPHWVFELSARLMEKLLVALLGGDGTLREHKTRSDSFVYYSKLKPLADDVQELALMCGYESALWGPYESKDQRGFKCSMYQVHIRRETSQFRQFIRSKNVKKVKVRNQRIVCFTVPNGTLITRRNGKVGIHGNSKHGYHLVRLLKMAREILTDGKVIVKRPDREELIAIRNGAWSYDQIVEWADRQDKELDEVMAKSKLPKAPDRAKLDKICINVVEKMM
jgi:predicted nucleotidyltransferase